MERLKDIMRFWKGTADEHMGAFAAQSAFFIFLSFFPIINLIVSLPKILPFSEDQMIELIYYVLPSSFEDYVAGLVREMYQNSSNSITIISLAIAVWSAAKGLTAVRYGLNEVYRSREARNYFIIRSISAVYTVVFVLLVLLLVPLNMFGTQIALYLFNQFPHFTDVTLMVYSIRSSATFILLFIMFDLLYTIVPSNPRSTSSCLSVGICYEAILTLYRLLCIQELYVWLTYNSNHAHVLDVFRYIFYIYRRTAE